MRTVTRIGIAALATAAAVAPQGTAFAAALGATASTPAVKKAKPKAKVASVVTAPRTITGPSVDMRWGPVQVQLVVQGTKILDIKSSYPTERARSAYINDQAIPMLKSQVLKAQGIKGVYAISGATMTSEAYGQSLQAALNSAGIKN